MRYLLLLLNVIFHLAYCQITIDDGEITFPDSTTLEYTTIDTTTTDSISADTTTIQDTTPTTTTTTTTTTEATTTTTEPTTVIPILFLTDSTDEISWSPQSSEVVIIEAVEGYKISVNITECNIDGGNGEYATITTDEYTNGLFFTYQVSRQPAYLYNNNRLFAEFVGTDASNFTAVFTRIGEARTTTTTEIPTTTIILPSPGYNDESTLLVYLAGRRFSEYVDPSNPELLRALRNAIGIMAAEYTEHESFPLNGSVTSDNVIINHLLPCSVGWPDSETCVQLNFSVPVNLVEDTSSLWTGYQMNTNHLRIMWDRYAEAYLPEGTTIYIPPGGENLTWAIVTLAVGSLIFAAVLLIVRHYGMKVSKMVRRRKPSDADSIISTSDRNSEISLPPHYLQDTPALFENAYPMYNPEKNAEYSEPSYGNSFQYSDYQNLAMDLEQEADEDEEVKESGA